MHLFHYIAFMQGKMVHLEETAVMYLLARHQKKQEKAKEREVRKVLHRHRRQRLVQEVRGVKG